MSFFDMFGPMFDPEGGSNRAGRQNPRKPSNDDPIILNVETDGGDGPQPSSNVPPKRPSGPRITSKPNRPRKPSNGSKIFIGVMLALAIVIGLFLSITLFQELGKPEKKQTIRLPETNGLFAPNT